MFLIKQKLYFHDRTTLRKKMIKRPRIEILNMKKDLIKSGKYFQK